MTDEKKTAEAAVKAAEKAYETASKKAAAVREKYAEAQADANAKARALAHARTNPALFEDDPLSVVDPGQPSPATQPRVSINTSGEATAGAVFTYAPPQPVVVPVEPSVAPDPVEGSGAQEPQFSDTPPWMQQTAAPTEPETKPKGRRVGSRRKAPAAEPPAAELAQPSPPVQQQFAPDGTVIDSEGFDPGDPTFEQVF
jgi:hypothetical protein